MSTLPEETLSGQGCLADGNSWTWRLVQRLSERVVSVGFQGLVLGRAANRPAPSPAASAPDELEESGIGRQTSASGPALLARGLKAAAEAAAPAEAVQGLATADGQIQVQAAPAPGFALAPSAPAAAAAPAAAPGERFLLDPPQPQRLALEPELEC
jgi:hypothetical protein